MNTNVYLILTGVFLFTLGLGLTLGFYYKNENEKTKYKNNFIEPLGLGEIVYLDLNDYVCYRERDCSQCSSGSNLPSCNELIFGKRTGKCGSQFAKCCRRTCYDADGDICFIKRPDCIFNCFCSDTNYNPKCKVINGNCYEPFITIKYMIFNETILYSNISAFFDIGQDNQANYFINKYKQNESVHILYDKNNPKKYLF